jgi:outer membrane protein assembly factor BamB
MTRRTLVFVVAFAVASAVPTPARGDDRFTFHPVWTVTLASPAWGTATDRFGVVVSSANGTVRALTRRGRTQWTVYSPNAQDGNPAITRSRVLIGRMGRVVALSRRDGAIAWEQPMDSDEVASVALAGRFALAGDASGTLRAFDAATGAVRWSVHHDGVIRAEAQIDRDSGTVLAAWDGKPAPAVRALDLRTGAERWRQAVREYTAAPQLVGGRAFVATSEDHGVGASVAAFDLRSGRAEWEVALPGSFQSDLVPAVDARDLVVADWVGNVSAIDPTTGNLRWSSALHRHIVDAHVVLFPRRVAVATADGGLFVLDRASGRIVTQVEPPELEGWAGALAPFGPGELLVALRVVRPPRIEVHRVP